MNLVTKLEMTKTSYRSNPLVVILVVIQMLAQTSQGTWTPASPPPQCPTLTRWVVGFSAGGDVRAFLHLVQASRELDPQWLVEVALE